MKKETGSSNFVFPCRRKTIGTKIHAFWGHAEGHIGGMLSKGLGMLSSAEIANLLGDVGACSSGKF